MPRAGLTPAALVDAAAELADAEGLESVTLAELAKRLGVRPPSLYAHIDGLPDLRARLAERGAAQLADELAAATAGRSGGDALRSLAQAYRGYALAHPGLYAALQQPAASQPAADRVVSLALAVLAGYGLEGEQALQMVRALRSALHGFVSLEAQGGFGLPLPGGPQESFAAMVELLDRGLRARGSAG